MWNERTSETACQALGSVVLDAGHRQSRRRCLEQIVVSPWSYPAKRGRGTIRLDVVEYRILRLLASRPNSVFTPRQIAVAISTHNHSVTAETLSSYVASLRHQLGFFSDYIQAVPYMGYRFKA